MTIFIILTIIILVVFSTKEKFQNNSKTLSYQEFKELYNKNFDPIVQVSIKQRTIPKIVFRTGPFKLTDAPEVMKQYLQKLVDQNPGYTQVYFDDDDCRNFIMDYFPAYLPEYDVLIPGAFKADLWRLLVIYKYGGIYNDIGHMYIRPINEIVTDQDNIIFCREDEKLPLNIIHNAFFASYPKSSVLLHIINNVIKNIRNRIYGDSDINITGPHACGVALNEYINKNINSPFYRGVIMDAWGNKIRIVEHINYGFQATNDNIINTDGTKCIMTKFPNYYNIMYDKRNTLHYGELWKSRQVYKN